MATKARAFKVQQQKDANPPKPKQPPKRRRDVPVDTSKPGVSASDRKAGAGRSGARNLLSQANAKAGASLEDSATGKPSRKSTRKSQGGVKRTANLRLNAVRKASSAKAIATRSRTKK
ncbi:MAG: hypothetical protein ABI779_13375 [Acidobacteriota bacterium]